MGSFVAFETVALVAAARSAGAPVRPPCGTWGCTLPDRHSGLHDLGHLPPSSKRQRVVRAPPVPPTPPLSPGSRVGADYQVTPLPDAEALPAVDDGDDRGDVRVIMAPHSIEEIFMAEAVDANARRRRMHERHAHELDLVGTDPVSP